MKTATKFLLGCLAVPVVAVVLVLLFAVVVLLLPTPEVENVPVAAEHALATLAEAPPSVETEPAESTTESGAPPLESPILPQRVHIDLEDGSFDIVPGETGATIRVEGQYDTGNYTLDLSQPAGSNEHLVRFYRKTFMLQQLKRPDDSSQNELRLYLPVGTVLDLDIAINKGEADVDLSRVPVRQLSLRFSKGKLNLEFKQLNPVELETMIVEASMGEAQLHGLGFARAREIRLGGSMGDFVFEFDGPLEADSRASIRVRMGNGQVRIPSETLVSLVDSSVFLGHLENRRGWSHENPENMPALDLDLSVSFGEIVVR